MYDYLGLIKLTRLFGFGDRMHPAKAVCRAQRPFRLLRNTRGARFAHARLKNSTLYCFFYTSYLLKFQILSPKIKNTCRAGAFYLVEATGCNVLRTLPRSLTAPLGFANARSTQLTYITLKTVHRTVFLTRYTFSMFESYRKKKTMVNMRFQYVQFFGCG